MGNSTDVNLAAAYIAFANAEEASQEYEKNFWAFDRFAEICLESPDEAWHSILEILARNPGPRVLRVLAAGPMEELLVHNGVRVIDRVEDSARINPQVAVLLGGVWGRDVEPSVWRRVLAARSHAW